MALAARTIEAIRIVVRISDTDKPITGIGVLQLPGDKVHPGSIGSHILLLHIVHLLRVRSLSVQTLGGIVALITGEVLVIIDG